MAPERKGGLPVLLVLAPTLPEPPEQSRLVHASCCRSTWLALTPRASCVPGPGARLGAA